MPDRDIIIWGDTSHGERILIRIIEPNQTIKAVPADERSISGPAYNQDRECENESCSNVFGVPQKYEDNPVFCSIECAEEVHVEDKNQEELRNETSSSSTATTNSEGDDDTEDSVVIEEKETDETGKVSKGVGTVDEGETDEDSTEASPDIGELRKKATEDATEHVNTTAVSSSTKQEYNRSAAVREYVKARADGVCEGCNTPAPFASKTGEPYLHAHHIHELSDGGSDTVDTVVALCPNCHYRVHHGEDGDEYNQELLEVVQRLENENE